MPTRKKYIKKSKKHLSKKNLQKSKKVRRSKTAGVVGTPLKPIDASQKKRLGNNDLKVNLNIWNNLSFWNASVMMVDIYRGEEISDNKYIDLMYTHPESSVRRNNRIAWTKRIIDAGWIKQDGFRAFMGGSSTNFPKMKGKSHGTITLEEITKKIQEHREELTRWMIAKEKSISAEEPVKKSAEEPVKKSSEKSAEEPEKETTFVGLNEVNDWEDL
tara:strand:+ start:129 stop:776 length:648 start_codon:yes stop_codon:yes gene_type:complete